MRPKLTLNVGLTLVRFSMSGIFCGSLQIKNVE